MEMQVEQKLVTIARVGSNSLGKPIYIFSSRNFDKTGSKADDKKQYSLWMEASRLNHQVADMSLGASSWMEVEMKVA